MSVGPPVRLFALGASHHHTPLEIREKFAVAPEKLPSLYEQLRATPGVREALVLNTCNRFEIYTVLEGHDSDALLESSLCDFQKVEPSEFARHRFVLRDGAAVGHLLAVASGIDSQIVGETEIFGQVKSAYSHAITHGTVGPVLNRMVQKCFQAAKHIRSSTPIGEGQISVASVSVDLTEKIFGPLAGCRVLVLGTGDVGEKTAKAMHSRGAGTITVLSRSLDRAKVLGGAIKASAGLLERLPEALAEHDIIVGSTSTTTPLVTGTMVRRLMRSRKLRPLFFIDLGIPRNFDASLAHVVSVFLYDLDDLARIADQNLAARRAAVDRCRRLVDEKAARIWEGIEPRLGHQAPLETSRELQTRRQVV